LDTLHIEYEFREYQNATHAFTNPESTQNGIRFSLPIAYNEEADRASWKEMVEFLKKAFNEK
jgi:dienelactone hydrolase